MKSLFIALFTVFAVAQTASASGVARFETSGFATVSIAQHSTETCMAIGCPAPEAYYTVSLIKEVGGTEILTYHVQTQLGFAPQNVQLGGITVSNGSYVHFEAMVISNIGRHQFTVIELQNIMHAAIAQ